MLSFSAATRTANLARMAQNRFDVLVIGGGITGAGIALDAAARGYSVALVEKDDFAAGTSGRSSRLVHGGLRYLEHGEFGLVRESLAERGTLLRLAPHLIQPVPMYMLADDRRSRVRYRLGLAAYDALAAGRNIGGHRAVSAQRVRAAVPGLRAWSRGFRYYEGQTDDARLTIEVARTAAAYGAVLANHARVERLLGGARVTGAVVTDEIGGQRFEVRAAATVNACGVWAGTDGIGAGGVRLVPSKGVHLVFRPGAVRTRVAMVLPSAAGDGRYLFVVPWEDRVYAGTTDTPYSGDLDHPEVDGADRDYVLAAVAADFPGVTGGDVVASWAGLRPLLDQGTGSDGTSTADLSRRHAVFEEPPGLFTITGGKLTTYRAMAEDLVRPRPGRARRGRAVLDPGHPARPARPGGAGRATGHGRGHRAGPAAAAGPRLVQRYGDDWREAAAMIGRDRSLGEPAADGLPVLKVELDLARSREMAVTDEDVLVRRTRLSTRDASVRLPGTATP